jgi:hypothetical protein
MIISDKVMPQCGGASLSLSGIFKIESSIMIVILFINVASLTTIAIFDLYMFIVQATERLLNYPKS